MQHIFGSSQSQPVGINVFTIDSTTLSSNFDLVKLEAICACIQSHGYNLGEFFVKAIRFASDRSIKNKLQKITQMVSAFLGGRTKEFDIVALLDTAYKSHLSTPKVHRGLTGDSEINGSNAGNMARQKMEGWSIRIVEQVVHDEAAKLVCLDGGLRVTQDMSWEFADTFSLASITTVAREKAPTCMRLLAAVAISYKQQESLSRCSEYIPSHHEPLPSGRGCNRRNPHVVSFTISSL